ncbi:hypothetical protein V6N11_034041 [Hibiscus sabdariffa]|uniref:Uncharacterized protein n=1 Tax=Hibiscus sabdariffa TaxID=183260 RepID=A0ABR2S1U3_9ROSI
MSDGSCSGPFRIHDNQYLDNYSPLESTKFELSANTPTMENIKNPKDIVITAADVVIVVAAVDGGAKQVDATNNEIQDPFTKRKRKKTSGVWEHFRLVKLYDETELCKCIHYGEKIKKLKDGTSTPLHRHIVDCPKLKAVNIDNDFKLHKCILSFVGVPPPYFGVCIYVSLFKCLKEWNIETNMATLTVDNAKTNDVVAKKLMEILNLQNKLVGGGKLFHVRCCAHILNLLVHDGLGEIEDIIHNVLESVKHVNTSQGRLHIFSELTKQLSMTKKYLILDVTT